MTSTTYAGETKTKKVARAMGYDVVSGLLQHAKGKANVVALAGDEAHDLGPIVAFGLSNDPKSVLLVDRNEEGLEVARARWPGVRTFCGDLSEVIAPWPVDVLVADFCGRATSADNRAGLEHMARQLRRPGGCVILTYLRGREVVKPASGPDETLAELEWILGRAPQPERLGSLDTLVATYAEIGFGDLARRNFAAGMVARGSRTSLDLGGEQQRVRGWLYTRVAWTLKYFDNNSPMGMVVLHVARHWPRDERRVIEGWDLSKLDPWEVLRYADEIHARGVDAAKALDVSPSTLVAWRAHKTMGTYGKDDEREVARLRRRLKSLRAGGNRTPRQTNEDRL